jgi:hypothetical protein
LISNGIFCSILLTHRYLSSAHIEHQIEAYTFTYHYFFESRGN